VRHLGILDSIFWTETALFITDFRRYSIDLRECSEYLKYSTTISPALACVDFEPSSYDISLYSTWTEWAKRDVCTKALNTQAIPELAQNRRRMYSPKTGDVWHTHFRTYHLCHLANLSALKVRLLIQICISLPSSKFWPKNYSSNVIKNFPSKNNSAPQ
jgi:hypothetical protein